MPNEGQSRLQELVAQVAASYFSNAHTAPNDIPAVISQIAASLGKVGAGAELADNHAQKQDGPDEAQRRLTTAQIRRSIRPDALVSFEDGRAYKTLRRHLSVRGMTPDQYREKWGLPLDYPMVAPDYSKQRSELARSLGLGKPSQRATDPGSARPAKSDPATEATAQRPRGRGRTPDRT